MTARTPRTKADKAAAAPKDEATTAPADGAAAAAPLDPDSAAASAPLVPETTAAAPEPEPEPEPEVTIPEPEAPPIAATAPLEGPPIATPAPEEPSHAYQPGEIGVVSLAVDSRETIRIIDEKTGEPVTSAKGLFEETAPGGGNVRCTKYLLREYRVGYFDRYTQALLVTPHTVLTAAKAAEITAVIEATAAELAA